MKEGRKLTLKEREQKAARGYNTIINQWSQIYEEFPFDSVYSKFGFLPVESITIKELEEKSWKYYNLFISEIERERNTANNIKLFYDRKYRHLCEFFLVGIEYLFIYNSDCVFQEGKTFFGKGYVSYENGTITIEEHGWMTKLNWSEFYNSFYTEKKRKVAKEDFDLVPYTIAKARICSFLKKEIIVLMEIEKPNPEIYPLSFTLKDSIKKVYLKDVYKSLNKSGFISEDLNSFPEFKQIFSGKKVKKKIKWTDANVEPLALFIKELRDKIIIKIEDKHWETTLMCFESYNKKGIPIDKEMLKNGGSMSQNKIDQILDAIKPLE